jgi:NTE family protein
VLPTAANDGQKFTNYLNIIALQAPIRAQSNFDLLERRFRAVCTNLVTGEPAVLQKGSIAEALRASSSVSFLLSPVTIDSLVLVDGGLIANIPAEMTRKEGADIVIAVNTTSELHGKQDLDFPWVVADQIMSIPMKVINERQLTFADITITPELGQHSSTDFSKIDSIITIGYNTTLASTAEISRLYEEKYSQRLTTNSFRIEHPVFSSNLPDLEPALEKFTGRSTIESYELLELFYSLNREDRYDTLFAEVVRFPLADSVRIIAYPRPLIQSISYEGIQSLEMQEVDSIMVNSLWKPCSELNIWQLTKTIVNLYRLRGYSLAELEKWSFDDKNGILRLKFNEGVIAKVEIRGNTSTAETVIRRELPFAEGDYFLNTKLHQGLTNLRSANLFENIVASVEQRAEGNVLILNVEEKITSLVRFGFKLDNENFPQLSVDLREESVFGSATELGVTSYFSPRANAFAIEHNAHRIFNTYLTYNIKGFYKRNDVYLYKTLQESNPHYYKKERSDGYAQAIYGFSLALGAQVQRLGNLIFRWTYEKDEINPDSRYNMVDGYKTALAIFRISTSFDTQDKYPFPTKGIRFTTFYEIASNKLGGDLGYTNLGGDYLVNIPFSNAHTFTPGLRIGFADRTLPLSQQYSLGGQYSFVGMRENEYRGRQLFVGSLDYRYRMPFRIFFDTYFQMRYNLGSVWEVQNKLRLSDFRHGVGLSLSFSTPIGPADFSIGRSFIISNDIPDYPLKFGPLNFYFSIGYYY